MVFCLFFLLDGGRWILFSGFFKLFQPVQHILCMCGQLLTSYWTYNYFFFNRNLGGKIFKNVDCKLFEFFDCLVLIAWVLVLIADGKVWEGKRRWDINTIPCNYYSWCFNGEGWTMIWVRGGAALSRGELWEGDCPHSGQKLNLYHHLSDLGTKGFLESKHRCCSAWWAGLWMKPLCFLIWHQPNPGFFFFWQKRLWNYVLCCLLVFTHCLPNSHQIKQPWIDAASTASL